MSKNKLQILAIIDNQDLLTALEELAEVEQAQLRLGRPQTPDIFVFSAQVKIVDREYLGQESWELYCNQLADKEAVEETTLIIADKDLAASQEQYLELSSGIKEVRYIQQTAVDLIVEAARQGLRNNQTEITAVQALEPGDVPPEAERIEIEFPEKN